MASVDRKHNIHNFLSRTYDNMSRRCRELPAYKDKLHITRQEFISWGKEELPRYMESSNLDVALGYTNRGISIDKIDDSIGYALGNLQWLTRKDNAVKGSTKVMVKVGQYDLDGNLIAIHSSMADAAKAVGGNYRRISNAVHRIRPTAYGYQWERLGD